MKKQKTKQSEESDLPLSEEEYADLVWQENFEREQEARHSELRQLSKDELIRLVIDVQDREEAFAAWLLSKGPGFFVYDARLDYIKEEFDKLREQDYRRTKNQKKGRRKQVDKKAAKEEAEKLGVDSFYGLLREAIILLKKNPKLRENKQTKVGAIRAIIVTLLCEPNRSRHNRQQSEWDRIVRSVVTSDHVYTAENQLEREFPDSF